MPIQQSSAVPPTCSACGLPITDMSYIGWNGHNYHNDHVPRHEPPQAWLPIDTAPKTDDAILLYEPFEGVVCQGSWVADDSEWFPSKGSKGFWKQPTHWMPLPPPPRSP
jgi:hypothetical protein